MQLINSNNYHRVRIGARLSYPNALGSYVEIMAKANPLDRPGEDWEGLWSSDTTSNDLA